MNDIVFDIETGPLPKEEIIDLLPAFNPDDVKLGNLKDPEKIKQKLREAEAKHRDDFFKNAALSPVSGRVLAIGVNIRRYGGRPDEIKILGDGITEKQLLEEFWGVCEDRGVLQYLIGFNTNNFDLPFLYKRSWLNRVRPPVRLRDGRWWAKQAIDIREIWQFGDKYTKGNLDEVAKFLRLPGKNGTGAEFAEKWERDRAAAIAYLKQDINVTTQIYDLITGNWHRIGDGAVAARVVDADADDLKY